MNLLKKNTLLLAFLALWYTHVHAQKYVPAATNLAARTWFQDAKFGLFIHWGVYSVLGNGEWVMEQQKITKSDYQKLPAFFNPTEFNANEWVSMAKAAGMKYITITSRHHDGFSMFNTRHSDWNIVQRTPYKKDPLKLLADECHKQGIKLFFYYSELDWYQENYFPLGRSGQFTGRPAKGDWHKYLDFMDAQLTELLTNYGDIAGIWFDGWWDKKNADWRLKQTYDLIHRLQPQCLIGNNHHQAVKEGEDFQMFERDLPGANESGYSPESSIGHLPLETCETMNKSWGFNIKDDKYKTTKELIHYLVKAAGNNANFLLNVGPMPNGKIQPEFVDTLQNVGKWMMKYGETIYGTRGGPISPKPWGVTTEKDGKTYVHVLNPVDKVLLLSGFPKKIGSVSVFGSKTVVKYKQDNFGLAIVLPEVLTEHDTILVIE